MNDSEERSSAAWICLFGLLILLVMMHAMLSHTLGRGIQPRLAAIRAKGSVASYEDLAKIRVPPAENAALVYEQAFRFVVGPSAHKDFDTLDTFLRPHERTTNPKLWDDARQIVSRYQLVFPLAEQAAARPKCWFETNWLAGPGAVFPYYCPIRKIPMLLAADAVLQAKDGRMDEAAHSVDLGFKTALSLKSEPTLMGVLIRARMIGVTSRALREIAQQGDISESQARAIYDTLGAQDLGPGYVKALEGERALCLWVFDEARRNPSVIKSLWSSSSANPANPVWQVAGYAWRPALNKDEMLYLDYYDKLIARAGLSWREVKTNPRCADPDPVFPKYALISNILCPVFTSSRRVRDDAIAHTAGSQILLALVTYKHRYGSYPSNLGTLRTRLGWTIPLDPFSGREFVYKPRDNGFLLYSLGGNLKDDGAQPLPSSTPPGSTEYYTDLDGRIVLDIIWRMNR